MRVGVHVPEVAPESGGAFTFVESVLAALAAARSAHEFVVVHPGAPPPLDGAGLECVRLPERPSPLEPTLDAAARELGLELVWFLTPEWEPVELPFFATVWDLEHRHQPHFPEVSVSGWTWPQRELFYRSVLPRATCIVTGSAEGARQIERFYAVPPGRILVSPFPVPAFPETPAREDAAALAALGLRAPFLYYPAQFWPHKNHVVLLHALARLGDAPAGLRLVLTGADKGNLAHVRATAEELGVAGRVDFLGFVERPLVAALYRRALALVFPSFFGPDNLPPLEAFALGCPVVAAALPGAEELFGDAALLVPATDEAAWADAVRRLAAEPALASTLAARGRARAGEWTAAGYVARVVERLDAFAPVRRTWSRSERYRHTT